MLEIGQDINGLCCGLQVIKSQKRAFSRTIISEWLLPFQNSTLALSAQHYCADNYFRRYKQLASQLCNIPPDHHQQSCYSVRRTFILYPAIMPPTIASPLRMLLLSTPETPPSFLKDVSHYEIRTPYYNAAIPIWRDELPTSSPELEAWKEEWLGQEAGEVVQAVGAWIACFRKPKEKADLDTTRNLLATIHEVVSNHTSSGYATSEPLLLAVGTQRTISPGLEVTDEEWENLCMDCGSWEWIDGELDGKVEWKGEGKKERNEFGERRGIERLKEALEACEWEGVDVDNISDDLGLENGFSAETAEVEREMMELKMTVNGAEGSDEGADEGVEELENTMLKMQAIKDMGADMPESERKKFAAKAVRDVMRAL